MVFLVEIEVGVEIGNGLEIGGEHLGPPHSAPIDDAIGGFELANVSVAETVAAEGLKPDILAKEFTLEGRVSALEAHVSAAPEERFRLVSEFSPQGDQPQAIAELVEGVRDNGELTQVLLGVTGSGKTYTMAKVIEATQRPALVLAPNKTLAAQLYGEFRSFFPDNAVEYFISYYDYYQPEAFIPATETYLPPDPWGGETPREAVTASAAAMTCGHARARKRMVAIAPSRAEAESCRRTSCSSRSTTTPPLTSPAWAGSAKYSRTLAL